MKQQKPVLLVVAGPTAVGKTAFSVALASYFQTSILSFDSRQCYRELNIGVARPSQDQLNQVRHYFIASHSIHEPCQAAGFAAYGRDVLSHLFQSNKIVISTGGTGLYLDALLYGLDEIPPTPLHIRNQLRAEYQEKGIHWLTEALQKEDPIFAAEGEMKNPQRMLRALEVMRATGQSIRLFYQPEKKQNTDFDPLLLGLMLPKESLLERIAARTTQMIADNLAEEARSVIPYHHYAVLKTVGYPEMFAYLNGQLSLEKASDQITIHTRQYAKRQITWFKKYEAMHWLHPNNIKEAIALGEKALS
jgi:tRNA dimethylallyltransferase